MSFVLRAAQGNNDHLDTIALRADNFLNLMLTNSNKCFMLVYRTDVLYTGELLIDK